MKVIFKNLALAGVFIILALIGLYFVFYYEVGMSPLSTHKDNVKFLETKLPLLEKTQLKFLANNDCKLMITRDEYYILSENPSCGWSWSWKEGRNEESKLKEDYQLLKKELMSWRANFSLISVQTNDLNEMVAIEFRIAANPVVFFVNIVCSPSCLRIYRYENPVTNGDGFYKSSFEKMGSLIKTQIYKNWYLLR